MLKWICLVDEWWKCHAVSCLWCLSPIHCIVTKWPYYSECIPCALTLCLVTVPTSAVPLCLPVLCHSAYLCCATVSLCLPCVVPVYAWLVLCQSTPILCCISQCLPSAVPVYSYFVLYQSRPTLFCTSLQWYSTGRHSGTAQIGTVARHM